MVEIENTCSHVSKNMTGDKNCAQKSIGKDLIGIQYNSAANQAFVFQIKAPHIYLNHVTSPHGSQPASLRISLSVQFFGQLAAPISNS